MMLPMFSGAGQLSRFMDLVAGRVPVVISDEWVAPAGVAWERCVVRLPEREVMAAGATIEGLEAEWPAMAAAATETYARHFSDERLFDDLIARLGPLRGGPARPIWGDRRVIAHRARQLRRRLLL